MNKILNSQEEIFNNLQAYYPVHGYEIHGGGKDNPALGYWAFYKGMQEVYDFALKNNIPIVSHCSGGSVYYRGKKKDKHHPIYGDIKLEGYRNKTFTLHYSNPLNYHMRSDYEIRKHLWRYQLHTPR